MHQVTWDLQGDRPRPRELGGQLSPQELRRVLPGTYSVTLKVGDTTATQTVVVEKGWLERLPGRVR